MLVRGIGLSAMIEFITKHVAVYRSRCAEGHVQTRPFTRNLSIVWGTKTFTLSVRYTKLDTWYLCVPCTLGYERGEG